MLQKRLIILSILLTIATPYQHLRFIPVTWLIHIHDSCIWLIHTWHYSWHDTEHLHLSPLTWLINTMTNLYHSFIWDFRHILIICYTRRFWFIWREWIMYMKESYKWVTCDTRRFWFIWLEWIMYMKESSYKWVICDTRRFWFIWREWIMYMKESYKCVIWMSRHINESHVTPDTSDSYDFFTYVTHSYDSFIWLIYMTLSYTWFIDMTHLYDSFIYMIHSYDSSVWDIVHDTTSNTHDEIPWHNPFIIYKHH